MPSDMPTAKGGSRPPKPNAPSPQQPNAGRVWCSRSGPRQTVATVWLSHPGKRNALSVAMWRDLTQCFQRFGADPDLRVVVIRGEGNAFASGADISEFSTHRSSRETAQIYHDEVIGRALKSVLHCPVPVVAAIDGPCVGAGLELACAADIRLATGRSELGLPTGRLGLPLGPIEMAVLLQVLGKATTLELLLEGRLMGSAEALAKGLVAHCIPDDALDERLATLVSRISAGSPHAARRNKGLVRALMQPHEEPRLSEGQEDACWDYADTQDYARGIDAFLSKTRPVFQNN